MPLTLPSDNKMLSAYINANKLALMESVITTIEYATEKNLPIVEAFLFEGTDFIITINSHTFKENLEQIFDYYVKNEKYELCPRVIKLIKNLTNEKTKEPRQKQ